jgi:hypothetical protein
MKGNQELLEHLTCIYILTRITWIEHTCECLKIASNQKHNKWEPHLFAVEK